jgi:trimeric autotransporter adhesin
MVRTKLKLRILGACALLLGFAVAVGCDSFFVDPTLTSVQVGPQSPSLLVGQSIQLTATGTYNDGSSKNITNSALWSSSAAGVASVSSSGKVTAAATISNPPGSATITASSGTQSASTTVSVNTGALQSIALTVSGGATSVTAAAGSTITLVANGTYAGSSTPQDITSQVTWTVANTTVLVMTAGSGSGTIQAGSLSGTSTTVTANLNGITSNMVTVTVQ